MKEDKTEPQLGDDEFFEAVIQKDFRNFDFQKQRDTWREGTDFTFAAEFLAKVAEDEGEAVDSTSVDKSSAIDVEAVSSSSDESSA